MLYVNTKLANPSNWNLQYEWWYFLCYVICNRSLSNYQTNRKSKLCQESLTRGLKLSRCHNWQAYSYLKEYLMNSIMIRLHQMQAFNCFFHCIFSFYISKSKNFFILPRQSTSFSQNCTFLLSKFRLTLFIF